MTASLQSIVQRIESLSLTESGEGPMLPPECYNSEEFFQFERERVFAASWICAGRVDQIPSPGDYLAVTIAGEPLLVVRDLEGTVRVMSAVCQHRGEVITCESGHAKSFRCPLHFWSYDLTGKLLGAPRMGNADVLCKLRDTVRLRDIRHEIWHGFVFVNIDGQAAPLAPSLAKLEPYWAGYEAADLVCVPPSPPDKALPWNWKLHVENFTDAYHPEFVHRGTHDFAPSVGVDGGVQFTPMAPDDNCIVRIVPMEKADGGMMRDGWGAEAAFPVITTLPPEQRKRIVFAIVAPLMTMMFAPTAIGYQILTPLSAQQVMSASDRVTGGGWLLPRSTVELPDFKERAAQVREGASKIWAQDLPVNLGMQAGKNSRFMPEGVYGPLEKTLEQFNFWLIGKYRGERQVRTVPLRRRA